MPRILLGTHNPSKIDRVRTYARLPGINLLSPRDLKLPKTEIEENGKDEKANAKIKAKAYYKLAKIPTIALDTGFYIDGLEPSAQPGKHVQRIVNVNDQTDDQERFRLMTDFYRQFPRQAGGVVGAYFLDVYCFYDGLEYNFAEAKRRVKLYDQIFEKDVHFPIASLYKVSPFNKFHHQLSQEEMSIYLQDSMLALESLITSLELPNSQDTSQ